MCISSGHPCLWTLSRNSALSFGEDVGGKSSARREFPTSWGVYIFWCPFIDFHIGANFFLDRNPLKSDKKRRGIVLLSIQLSEALAIAYLGWADNVRAHADMKIITAKRPYNTLDYTQKGTIHTYRSPRDWHNHTRDIYHWLRSIPKLRWTC